ncbi:MAG TPA: glycoside hydrolase family 88 protein [Verrucomicrobiae bacterium]|nr:glycoside hydrolase family 88 protein [Verrucomicrobiae bacterium]
MKRAHPDFACRLRVALFCLALGATAVRANEPSPRPSPTPTPEPSPALRAPSPIRWERDGVRVPADMSISGATPIQWSARMADSQLDRVGDRLAWKAGGSAKWDYTTGLFTLSLLKLHEATRDSRYLAYVEATIGSFVLPDGTIRAYKPEEYQLDHINPGKTLLALHSITKEERYLKAAARLRRQLESQPRTAEGAFWHKQRYPFQIWLDGIYMADPFLAQYATICHEPMATFDDAASQVRLSFRHMYDPETGLLYHGWDEKRQQSWANPLTGTSSNFWGRAMGWYGMALVDTLDWFPTNHPARAEILDDLRKLCAGVLKFQEPRSGLWYQVMDQGGRQGNYLEASASSMFVYMLAKSFNRHYGIANLEPDIRKGYQGVIAKFVKEEPSAGHRISLVQCCSVAGLGYGRDGSYEYYIGEPIVENDLKGIGPFILAGIEVQQMLETRATNAAGSHR